MTVTNNMKWEAFTCGTSFWTIFMGQAEAFWTLRYDCPLRLPVANHCLRVWWRLTQKNGPEITWPLPQKAKTN